MIRILNISLLILLFISVGYEVSYGQLTHIKGVVTDSIANPVENASVVLLSTSSGTSTDKNGAYYLNAPADGKEYEVVFSHIGFKSIRKTIKCTPGEIVMNIALSEMATELGEIMVRPGINNRMTPILHIPVKDIHRVPSPSGSFEAILKTMPGVSSNNELTSQYSVRGGNFDENIVYVNDIEIFRPFLIRSGEQEGLSFINPDLVSSVKFSSGGFSGVYGDRMSSVLDINYKKPVSSKGSFSPGLLTSSSHLEGVNKSQRFTWLIGVRYKSSRFMLNTLDARGNYQPVFADIQSLVSYKTSKRSTLSLLSAYSSNTYNFLPRSRESTFGSEAMAYRLYVLFGGREKDRYSTLNTVLTWEFSGNNDLGQKIILSGFNTAEREYFDIRSWYSLNTLDKNTGSENFSDSLMNIGIGSSISHGRNRLYADIFSLNYKGVKKWVNSSLNWGIKARSDNFNDRMREWTMVDSAGYSLPSNGDILQLSSFTSSVNKISNWLFDTYLDGSGSFPAWSRELSLEVSIRALYDAFTKEFLISPRGSVSMEAGKDLSFYISGGMYYQPPFYREMRYPDGTINRNIKSQRSVHTVIGMTYRFRAWDRPFTLTGEFYNKTLSNIIPYRLDNLRVIYSGINSAEGFSRGLDFRLNGEFVPDAESWISLSVMDSKLKIPSENMGFFPSPSDQTFNMNVFFQDYLPGYPSWRAHINISFVTGIPVISPYNNRYDQFHRLPSYRRVDLGITRVIKGPGSPLNRASVLSYIDEIYAGAEIFNLLDINNTISYFWVRTVNNLDGQNRQFAVPNYLTGRSLNFKLSATF
jgi:hypothetical protein